MKISGEYSCNFIPRRSFNTFGEYTLCDETVKTILTTSGLRELMVIAAGQSILSRRTLYRTLSQSFSPFPGFCARELRSAISWRATPSRRACVNRDKYRSGFFRLRYIYGTKRAKPHTGRKGDPSRN